MDMPIDEVTALLQAIVNGQKPAEEKLFVIVYGELRAMARNAMRQERREHTLQPTALVNEVFLRLVRQKPIEIKCRAHFFSIAVTAMRRILVDHARKKRAQIRGGEALKVSLEGLSSAYEVDIDLLALDQQLIILEKIAPRQFKIIELRFFGGLTIDEVAACLELSPATVYKELKEAKGWLYARLS